jgi:hypothetical protein
MASATGLRARRVSLTLDASGHESRWGRQIAESALVIQRRRRPPRESLRSTWVVKTLWRQPWHLRDLRVALIASAGFEPVVIGRFAAPPSLPVQKPSGRDLQVRVRKS